MTFTNSTHEVAPARLQAPGAVTHEEQTPMSTENRTETTTTTDDHDVRLRRIESKLDALIAEIGTGSSEGDTVFSMIERVWDVGIRAATATLRRDRLVLAAVRPDLARPASTEDPGFALADATFELEMAEVGDRDTVKWARRVIADGGALPVTINDDGTRRA